MLFYLNFHKIVKIFILLIFYLELQFFIFSFLFTIKSFGINNLSLSFIFDVLIHSFIELQKIIPDAFLKQSTFSFDSKLIYFNLNFIEILEL